MFDVFKMISDDYSTDAFLITFERNQMNNINVLDRTIEEKSFTPTTL